MGNKEQRKISRSCAQRAFTGWHEPAENAFCMCHPSARRQQNQTWQISKLPYQDKEDSRTGLHFFSFFFCSLSNFLHFISFLYSFSTSWGSTKHPGKQSSVWGLSLAKDYFWSCGISISQHYFTHRSCIWHLIWSKMVIFVSFLYFMLQ